MNSSDGKVVPSGLAIGSLNWALTDSNGNKLRSPNQSYIAPSVLLPAQTIEPKRFDVWSPSHPRGSGASWPPEARIDSTRGPGRFPIAGAWTGRRVIGDVSWVWDANESVQSCTPIEAICLAVSETAKSYAGQRPLAVVVPNDLRQAEQQAIIDACARSGISASLLWLPVAAALAWLADNQGNLPPPTANRSEPLRVCVVHADWGYINLADLQLVPWPSKRPNRWVPARRNPSKDSNIPGFGWQLEARASRKATVENRWQTLFSTPNPEASGGTYEFDTRDAKTLLKSLQGWDIEQQELTTARVSVEKWLVNITPRSDVVIVLGDWADELASLERLASDDVHNSFVCLAGEQAESYLAKGAAIFKSRQLKGEVCYLDSLPQLEMLIERKGEYVWYPLLRTEEEFVPGGLEWSSPEAIDVAVRKGERDVKLVVWHEEYAGVRELTARLEEPAVERIPGALHVSATPAQGNAVLRIDLLQGKGKNRQSIVANWKRMRQEVDEDGLPHNRDSYLESLPRAYPEPLPRLFSPYKWAAVRKRDSFRRPKVH
jgi:hypothetical protein